jgi:hypothetical protein
MGRIYNFPCKREDIDKCCDLKQLKEWQHQFELSLDQMESDYGGIENVPEKLYKYAKANELNLKQIKFKIRKLTGPVTSAGVLKAFHDEVKRTMPNEYGTICESVKMQLGKEDWDWDELIKYRKNGRC